jgi:glycosyltransferase involved in cell wall biosynthesis
LAERSTLVAEAYFHRIIGTYRKCVDLFLAPSEFVRDKFVEHGWDSEKFEVLPHFQGIHPVTEPPKDGAIVYLGRLSREKGLDDLLHAMQRLPHVQLVIAGDGPQREELEKLSASLLLPNVKFVGHVEANERNRLIAESRFTVLPSHAYETLGKSILESYALGRAVIATDIGSRREFVHDGETGLLYRGVNQLVEAIALLTAHPELAASMGRAGWELVRRNHAPEQHYQTLVRLYERLIATGREQTSVAISGSKKGARNQDKLRVAFIGGRGVISKYSGIESYYEEVGERLAAMGHDVTVYCRNHFTPALSSHNGMTIVRFPTLRSKHFETVIHTLLSSAHALTQKYDLVHYHALGPALFSILPRMTGIRTAVTVQGLDWQRRKWGRFASWILRLGEKASVKFPNQTMVVSRTLQQRYREKHGNETIYVPNGGILRNRREPHEILEWGLKPGGYVLFLGRFSPEKGCHLLVEAFEQIEAEATLVMAGASSYCDEYSRELRTHASERIRILDWVSGDTLDELLTNAMIFVLPSDMEGLSLALLDAMGAGLCVLASDAPENQEAVDGAGFTFQRGNVTDLADRLRFLIANPAVRQAAGQTARRRVEEEYQWQRITEQIESAYFRMLGRQPGSSSVKKPVAAAVIHEDAVARRRAG